MEVIINHNDSSLTLKRSTGGKSKYQLKSDAGFDKFTDFLELIFINIDAEIMDTGINVKLININEDSVKTIGEW